MSTIDVNQILNQMRVLEAQAKNEATPIAQGSQADFGQLLKQSIDGVNETQQNAAELARAFETGEKDVDLAEVMIAVQKSSVSFQAMVQVRNKLVEAYKDVMNMPM